MYHYLDGKNLNSIIHNEKSIDLWITGGIITITDKIEIEKIMQWMKESKKRNDNNEQMYDYIRYMIMNES